MGALGIACMSPTRTRRGPGLTTEAPRVSLPMWPVSVGACHCGVGLRACLEGGGTAEEWACF